MSNKLEPIIQDEGRYEELVVRGREEDIEGKNYWVVENDSLKGRRYTELNPEKRKIILVKFY